MMRPRFFATDRWLVSVVLFATAIGAGCGAAVTPPGGTAIGPAGGVIAIADGPGAGASIVIPAGALDHTVAITLRVGGAATGLPEGATALGPTLEIGPDGLVFARAVTLMLPSRSAPDRVFTRQAGAATWTGLVVANFDPARGLAVVTTTHLSEYVPAALAGADAGGTCAAGLVNCAANCTSLDTDPLNCGGCGHACGSDAVCLSGVCVATPPSIDASTTDDASSGGADDAGPAACARDVPPPPDGTPICGASELLCASGCSDISRDSNNCGRCGYGCRCGQTCIGGTCRPTMAQDAGVCPAGTIWCARYCADIQNDYTNCGGCRVNCPSGQRCRMGACAP